MHGETLKIRCLAVREHRYSGNLRSVITYFTAVVSIFSWLVLTNRDQTSWLASRILPNSPAAAQSSSVFY